MRDQLGGIGLGAMILYKETREGARKRRLGPSGQPAGARHGPARRACRCGARAGSRSCTIGAGTNGPTSTQANGFFGTNLKYCGYDAIVIQGQSKDWVYLYINDDVIELRDAGPTSARTRGRRRTR